MSPPAWTESPWLRNVHQQRAPWSTNEGKIRPPGHTGLLPGPTSSISGCSPGAQQSWEEKEKLVADYRLQSVNDEMEVISGVFSDSFAFQMWTVPRRTVCRERALLHRTHISSAPRSLMCTQENTIRGVCGDPSSHLNPTPFSSFLAPFLCYLWTQLYKARGGGDTKSIPNVRP